MNALAGTCAARENTRACHQLCKEAARGEGVHYVARMVDETLNCLVLLVHVYDERCAMTRARFKTCFIAALGQLVCGTVLREGHMILFWVGGGPTGDSK